MKAAISHFQIALEALVVNEKIHRAAGDVAQADLDLSNAEEFRAAVALLLAADSCPAL